MPRKKRKAQPKTDIEPEKYQPKDVAPKIDTKSLDPSQAALSELPKSITHPL